MYTRDETIQAFSDLALNASDTAKAKAQRLIQERIKEILGNTGLSFNYETAYIPSVGGQNIYSMPANCNRIVSASFSLNNIIFPLRVVNTLQEFNSYRVTNMTSNFPFLLYVENNNIHPYPYPSSSEDTFIVNYIKRVPDMSFADLTKTVSFTAGSTTATSTSLTSNLIGKYVKGLDGIWYTIVDVPSSTELTLKQEYAGLTNSGSTTIAELVPLPDGYEMTPVYMALADYYISDESKQGLYDRFSIRSKELIKSLNDEFGSTTDNVTGFAGNYNKEVPRFFVAP